MRYSLVICYALVAFGFFLAYLTDPPANCGEPTTARFHANGGSVGAFAAAVVWPMGLGVAIERSARLCEGGEAP